MFVAGALALLATSPVGVAADGPSATLSVGALQVRNVIEASDIELAGVGPEAQLVRTIDTSNAAWGPNPSSSDPSGLAYWPEQDQLIVADGEIDEVPSFLNANIFEVDRATGSLERSWLSNVGSAMDIEPVGAAYDPIANRLFLSSDVAQEIHEMTPGADGDFGTGDDAIDIWSAGTLYEATDPEGLAFGGGALWIADGTNKEVYRIGPGPNGDFGDGDDAVSHFDVGGMGISTAADGIEYDTVNDLLYLASVSPGEGILELTPGGSLLRTIGLDALPGGAKPAGVALAPASSGGGTNLYLADRNVDNAADPFENDGRIFELHSSGVGAIRPNTTITGGQAQGSSTTSTSASFTFTGTNGPTSFQCKLDAGAYVTCASPKSYTSLASGSHTFSVRAINAAGPDPSPATRAWTITGTTPPPPGQPFTDIGGHPFATDIAWLFDEGITGGCTATTFCPNANVSRDQMASFLDRALGLPTTTTDFFTDDEGNIHEAAINRLAAAGITGGCASGKYCPKAAVKRDQMASFLARAYDLPVVGTDFFADDDANQHELSINRLAASGITGGCGPNTYCPSAAVTRGQMSAFLHRADPLLD